jgi:hypothetical protein
MPQTTNTFEVFADYNQFFLLDAQEQPRIPKVSLRRILPA